MSVAEETDWPATEVIVSPWARPALSAGEPDRVPEMVTPLLLVPPPLVAGETERGRDRDRGQMGDLVRVQQPADGGVGGRG